jgi:hypothetical protein
MNVFDGDRIKTFRENKHAYHDWSVSRANKLPQVAPIPTKAYFSRYKRPYIGWPIGEDANRTDGLYPFAGPKVEAG